jgi:hypothetical protein
MEKKAATQALQKSAIVSRATDQLSPAEVSFVLYAYCDLPMTYFVVAYEIEDSTRSPGCGSGAQPVAYAATHAARQTADCRSRLWIAHYQGAEQSTADQRE